MAEHILVALDKSSYAQAAGEIAKQLAAAQESRLTAYTVVNVRRKSGNFFRDLAGWFGFEPAVVPEDVVAEKEEDARTRIDAWVEGARATGINVDGRVDHGKVDALIKDAADGSDLLVMGLRGETEERFEGQGGAMAGWLTENVTVPILFATPASAPLKAVALGYDGSDDAKHGVAAIRRFIAPLGIPVHVMHVSDAEDAAEVLGEVDELLPSCELHKHVYPVGESRHDTLLDKTRELGAQLLVLGFHGRNALRDFVVGSSTERVLLEGDIAVLVAH